MKFYRYMSLEEFDKLTRGEELVNLENFAETKNSTAVGFCFLPEWTIASGYAEDVYTDEYEEMWYELDAVEMHSVLNTTSIFDEEKILVEFEGDKNLFHKSEASYVNPFTQTLDSGISVEELCATRYNRDILRPIRYAMANMFGVEGNRKQYNDFNSVIWYAVNL
ncbi:MAG: hypothetical protein ACLTBR_03340 [Anaerostipes sp.]|uniref:hypothetical protein n=1 Tax=Anaerostipes sp. TaxID=1872530 RepID=UPI003991897B